MLPASGVPPTSQPFLPSQTPMTPMSSLAGSPPVLGAAYAHRGPVAPSAYGLGPGGFDPRMTHAAPAGSSYNQGYAVVPTQSPPAQAAYDPFASSQSSPSVSSVPSSQYQNRPPLSVVGSSSTGNGHSDSIVDLKRRQQQVVDSYEQGITGAHAAPIQHIDSGVRAMDPASRGPAELPPVYTPN